MGDPRDRQAAAQVLAELPVPEPQFSVGEDLADGVRAGVDTHPAAQLEPVQRRVNLRREETYIPYLRVPALRRCGQRELFDQRLAVGVVNPGIGDREALDQPRELMKLLRHRPRSRGVGTRHYAGAERGGI